MPKTLTHSEPEAYSECWAIQNSGIFKTVAILATLSNIYNGTLWKTANVYNYFCKFLFVTNNYYVFSQYRLFISSSSWNKYDFFIGGLIFTPEGFFNIKKYEGRGRGAWNREFWHISSKFYSNINYYFWLSTFSSFSATS